MLCVVCLPSLALIRGHMYQWLVLRYVSVLMLCVGAVSTGSENHLEAGKADDTLGSYGVSYTFQTAPAAVVLEYCTPYIAGVASISTRKITA